MSPNRTGGKNSYAEWAHTIGIFQTLIYMHVDGKEGNRILDVGCGSGILAIASEPYIGAGGKYLGIDVAESEIDFCQKHYPDDKFEFASLRSANPFFSAAVEQGRAAWPVDAGSIDLVTALSVWTHLASEDAAFYVGEIARVLRPGGRAIITFFLLDDVYDRGLAARSDDPGRFHRTPQNRWVFDQPSYGSDLWFNPQWARVPEAAIGVREEGIRQLAEASGLDMIEKHHGNWKEVPGLYFQDVLVFEKRGPV
jgi:SAM-dependent methyltransferase